MERGALGPLGVRPLFPGAKCELSGLTLTVSGRVGPDGGRGIVEALHRAREMGITTFDTVDSPDASVAETCLARAFPEGDRAVVVVTPGGPGRATPMLRAAVGREARFTAIPRPDPSFPHGPSHDLFQRLYEIEVARTGPSVPPASSADTERAYPNKDEPVILRCRSLEDVVEASRRPPPRILSGSYSLLDRTLTDAASRAMGAGFTWIARDPFAGGRLDGSRFLPRTPGSWGGPPRSVRDLEAEFGAVAGLGFLAQPKRRTLAQAALHFVHRQAWVATTCLPIPSPERWREFLGFTSSPPLDEGELTRVDALTGALSTDPFRPEVGR